MARCHLYPVLAMGLASAVTLSLREIQTGRNGYDHVHRVTLPTLTSILFHVLGAFFSMSQLGHRSVWCAQDALVRICYTVKFRVLLEGICMKAFLNPKY